MAEVTGLTADRMRSIEANAVVGGSISGDNLVLQRQNQSTFVAGNVRGPQGPIGPDGNPPGTFIVGGWSVSPIGYLLLNGQTVIGGVVTYPNIATMFPSWVVGSNLVLPNADGRSLMGSAGQPGVTLGSNTHELTIEQMPNHAHGMPHSHGINHTHTLAAHHHTQQGTFNTWTGTFTPGGGIVGTNEFIYRDNAYNSGYAIPWNSGPTGGVFPIAVTYSDQHNHSLTIGGSTTSDGSATLTHTGNTVSQSTPNTSTNGSGHPVNHTPAHITVRVAVKV